MNQSQAPLSEKSLLLELKNKDDEIAKLKKLLDEQARALQLATKSSSPSSSIKDETSNLTSLTSDESYEKREEHMQPGRFKSYNKEIIFHGTRGVDKDEDIKPSNDDIVQMHYTIQVYHCTRSTLQCKVELGKQPDCPIDNIYKDVIIIEDSRRRGNGQSFEFILGDGPVDHEQDQQQQQVTTLWEDIVRGMSRGEVALITMKFDSMDELKLLSLYPDKISIMNKLHNLEDVETIGYEVKCRIELIDFWKYKKPFRPFIVTL